ncbi:MAG: hypothetical protein II864_01840 [Prevotella sp.]|nr:hypothetical protein [Prevotella sp.]
MEDNLHNDAVCEPASSLTSGMSESLRGSGLLSQVRDLSHNDKACLIRYIYATDELDVGVFGELNDDCQPYTIDELNARIDEAEEEMDRGEGKTFEEMMAGFKQQLLWLK